jgi:predicted MFS family arabinose efflux permease
MLACCVGLIVLPLFSPQPLGPVIAASLHASPQWMTMYSMLSLAGYASGLLLLVPLCDLIAGRCLACGVVLAGAVALAAAANADGAAALAIALFAIGVSCSAIQMLVPLAAAGVPEEARGRVIGTVMSGLMLGILCSRPLASITAQHLGWRTLYAAYAGMFAVVGSALWLQLPNAAPMQRTTYARIVGSMWHLLRDEPVLRRHALSQAFCMASFNLFWTAVAARLQASPFALGGDGIGLFALAGAAGVIVAPIAGRLGDQGRTRAALRIGHLTIVLASGLAALAGGADAWTAQHRTTALAVMVAAAFTLDLGVIADQTLGRRAVNLLQPAARGRLNGLYTGIFFVGGAAGAAAAGPLATHLGWSGICVGAAVTGVCAMCIKRA